MGTTELLDGVGDLRECEQGLGAAGADGAAVAA